MHWTDLIKRLEINLSRKQVRSFGLILSGLILGIFCLRIILGYEPQWIGILVGLVIGVIALTRYQVIYIIYIPWMILARLIGMAVTFLLLGLMFYLIFTPIGFVMRVVGRDPLRLKKRGETYWVDRESGYRTNYERMF